jgi:integration host factor subunit beta
MPNIQKADICRKIYNETGIEPADAKKIIDMFMQKISAELIMGNRIELRGFGTFEVRERKGRTKARNPRTGESVSVISHNVAAFRPGKELRQAIWPIKNMQEDI